MPRDATQTRALLRRAAESRFARDGVAGARLLDIVRDAGQANESAISYHFGSRDGLLARIVGVHLAAMEEQRMLPREGAGLRELVEAVVVPTAALLRTGEGRDFLRITEQLAGYSGVGTGRPDPVLRGTRLAQQLARLEELMRAQVRSTYARERAALLVTFLTSSLAERARSIEAGGHLRLGHARYVAHLVGVLTGALGAPVDT
ncbi:MAG: TetR family transcriptional regulator [Actinomycetota bacterium]|nr:TetR family transcriptional regulator [Actinomycetota bacterium]